MLKIARILTIDGGGIRGLMLARLLAHIEEEAGAPIHHLFHLIAGTSTGGILGIGLSAPGPDGSVRFSAAELAALYRNRTREIFHAPRWRHFLSLRGAADERYEARRFEGLLKELLEDTRLSEALSDLLVTSYDLSRRRPLFFESWAAQGLLEERGNDRQAREFRMRDMARATSAAPTYFEPALISNALGEVFPLIDGGVYANNPAAYALHRAKQLYPRADRYLVLSLGTRLLATEIPYDKARNWGAVGWARPILHVIFDGGADVVDHHLRLELDHPQQKLSTYVRLELSVAGHQQQGDLPSCEFDDIRPQNLARLEAQAQRFLQQEQEQIGPLIAQLQEPRTPFDALRPGLASMLPESRPVAAKAGIA